MSTKPMTPARKAALSGLSAALSAVLLAAGTLLPTLQLSLYAALSALPMVLAAEGAALHGLLSAAAATLTGFILLSDKAALLPYALFFGWYGVVYVRLLGRMNRWAALALKALGFNAALAAGLLLSRLLLVPLEWSPWVFFAVGQPIFLLYDYVLGLFLSYYARKLRPFVMGGRL